MIKIAIIDDEITELQKNAAYVEAYFRDRENTRYIVDTFTGPAEFITHLSAGNRADVYILDIVMPQMDGIELGTYVKRIHRDARIIYLTTSGEYGVASYDVQAADYLLKPCSPLRLKKALDRVIDTGRHDTAPRFCVKVPDGVCALMQRDILYVEYYEHRLIVHMTDGRRIKSITQRDSLAVLAGQLLKEKNFLRISASFVINMDHIVKLSRTEFEVADGKRLQISRTYNDCRSVYLDYILKNN